MPLQVLLHGRHHNSSIPIAERCHHHRHRRIMISEARHVATKDRRDQTVGQDSFRSLFRGRDRSSGHSRHFLLHRRRRRHQGRNR